MKIKNIKKNVKGRAQRMKTLKNNCLAIILANLLSFIIINCSVYGQVTQNWIARYSLNSVSYYANNIVKISKDSQDNILVAGNINGKIITVKYNQLGVQQWLMTYDNAAACDMTVDNNGNVYVVGYSGYNSIVLKYTGAGALTVSGMGQNNPYLTFVNRSVVTDASGNVYIGYYENDNLFYGWNCNIVKYNSSGVLQWNFDHITAGEGGFYGNSSPEIPIVIDAQGNVYAGGCSGTENNTNLGHRVMKLSSSGSVLWGNYSGIPYSNIYSIALDNNGNIFSTATNGLSKYNNNGVLQWASQLTGRINRIAVFNNSIYLAGTVNTNVSDITAIKFDQSGALQWQKFYNGTANDTDAAAGINIDINENIYVTGYTKTTQGGHDYIVLKYDNSGAQSWVVTYNGPNNSNDKAYGMVLNNDGSFIVSGTNISSNWVVDFCTIKYSEPNGIKPLSGETPNSFSLSQNYPNPFNPSTKLRFSITRSSDVKLVVFDMTGKIIDELANGRFGAGVYEVDWNASKLSSGTYFYRIIAGDFSDTKKMILVK